MRHSQALCRRMAWLSVFPSLALVGCGSVGVGLAANNQGAALGLSTGVPLPTLSTPRDRRQALPPPTLVDPSAGTDTRQAAQ